MDLMGGGGEGEQKCSWSLHAAETSDKWLPDESLL